MGKQRARKDQIIEIRKFAIRRLFVDGAKPKRVLHEIRDRFEFLVSAKTLKRWLERFKNEDWNFEDFSKRPKTIHMKVTPELEDWIVGYRKMTEWGPYKIKHILLKKGMELSESSIGRVVSRNNLSRGSKSKGKRLKWIRWQRDAPNSLWQADHTEEQDGRIRLNVEDDCSRYLLATRYFDALTTRAVCDLLDELISFYGRPRQILTDNSSIYREEFDRWCSRRGIEHAKGRINKPTTTGKVEKSHDTFDVEIHKYADAERFRYVYNTFRPHMSLFGKTPAEVYNEFHRLLFFDVRKPKKLKNQGDLKGQMS